MTKFIFAALLLFTVNANADLQSVIVTNGKPVVGAMIQSDNTGAYIDMSAIVWPTTAEESTYTNTSATVISWNVTTVAGTSGPCIVCLGASTGTGSAFLWAKSSSITPPAELDGITNAGGYDIAVGAGAQCIAAGVGDHIHTISKATGDVEITRTTDLVTRQ